MTPTPPEESAAAPGTPPPTAEAPPVDDAANSGKKPSLSDEKVPDLSTEAPPSPPAPPPPPEAPAPVAAAPEPPAAAPAPEAPPPAPAPAAEPAAATEVEPKPKPKPRPAAKVSAPPPPPPVERGFIGNFFRPPGGPIKVAQRVGILILALVLVAILGVAGWGIVGGRSNGNSGNNATNGNPSPAASATSPSASPTPTGITVQDPVNEFSISRPQGWVARALASPDPNIAMIIGPDAPYPIADFVAVTIHKLPFPLTNNDVAPFKDFILQLLGSDLNIIEQTPSPVINGHAGYYFVWSYPKATPTTLHSAYYLIDGDRFVSILLQIEPPTDSTSLANLSPIFQQMAQSFHSYHVTPTKSSTPTSTVTGSATP
jgi:hypothetical protein